MSTGTIVLHPAVPTPTQQAQFEQDLFTWLASSEAALLLKPMLDTALAKVGNPWVRAILALFVVPALQSEMAKLAASAGK